MTLQNENEIYGKLHIMIDRMMRELNQNSHKPSILEYVDITELIRDIEYHKAKLLIAIRNHQKQAIDEYLADTMNLLFALGNALGIYEVSFVPKDKEDEFILDKKAFNKRAISKRKEVKISSIWGFSSD